MLNKLSSSGTPGSLVPVQEVATPAPGGDVVWVVSSVTQRIGRVTYLGYALTSLSLSRGIVEYEKCCYSSRSRGNENSVIIRTEIISSLSRSRGIVWIRKRYNR